MSKPVAIFELTKLIVFRTYPETGIGSTHTEARYEFVQRPASGRPLQGQQVPSTPSARTGPTLYDGSGQYSACPEQTASTTTEDDTFSPQLTRLSRAFLEIPMGKYNELSSFIVSNAEIVSQSEIDNLIAEARVQKKLGKNAQTLVDHALILRRCKELNAEERSRFFRRMGDRSSTTLKNFLESSEKVLATIRGPTEIPVLQGYGGQNSRVRVMHIDNAGRTIQPAPSRTELDRSQTAITDIAVASRRRQTRTEEFAGHERQVTEARSAIRDRSTRHAEEADRGESPTRPSRQLSISPKPVARMPTTNKASTGRQFDGTDGDMVLDPSKYTLISSLDKELTSLGFKKRKDARSFYTVGRVGANLDGGPQTILTHSYKVFALLWHEPAGGISRSFDLSAPIGVIRSRYGTEVYSHILRMVVAKEGHGYCLCL